MRAASLPIFYLSCCTVVRGGSVYRQANPQNRAITAFCKDKQMSEKIADGRLRHVSYMLIA
jgi:hypothetical protein